MKAAALIVLFALAQQPPAATAEKAVSGQPCSMRALVGTWQIIESDGKPFASDGRTVYKHVTPTHYFVLNVDASGLASYGHGGPYTASADTYAESITQGFGSSFEALRGLKGQFRCSVSGDRWHVVGSVPGVPGEGHVDETWQRVRQ
jgi:hypothetical protein